jgi:hypothetical protein
MRRRERPYISATRGCVRYVGVLMRFLSVANLTIFIGNFYDNTKHVPMFHLVMTFWAEKKREKQT